MLRLLVRFEKFEIVSQHKLLLDLCDLWMPIGVQTPDDAQHCRH